MRRTQFEGTTAVSPRNIEILAYEETPLGLLCLRRRELLSAPGTFLTEVTLDHEYLMGSLHTDSERALARTGVEWHGGRDLRVLIGGLGLGYTAREVLSSDRVAAVEVIELLGPVIGWLEADRFPLAAELKADPRLSVREGDVYGALAEPPTERFDVVLIDVDHSPDERLGAAGPDFYREDGLSRARRHLLPGGVLGVWSYAESSDFERALRRTFDEVRVEPVTFRNLLVDEERTDWLFFAR